MEALDVSPSASSLVDVAPPADDIAPAKIAASEHEGDAEFQDAEAEPIDGPSHGRSPSTDGEYDDVKDAEFEEAEEASLASKDEIFETALDRMVSASSTDVLASLPSESMGTAQEDALKWLNEMNSGTPSLDASLLEHASEDDFRYRVEKIAEAKGISPNDELLLENLHALLPLVRAKNKDSEPILSQPSMHAEDGKEERDEENRSGLDGSREENSEALEGHVDQVEAHLESEKLDGDTADPTHEEDLPLTAGGEDLSSHANTENDKVPETHMEDLVVLSESTHEVASGDASDSDGGACKGHVSNLSTEAISDPDKDETDPGEVSDEIVNGDNTLLTAESDLSPDIAKPRSFPVAEVVGVEDDRCSESVNGEVNAQEEVLESSIDSDSDEKLSRNFQVVETAARHDVVGDGNSGGGDNADIAEDKLKAESFGPSMSMDSPLNYDSSISLHDKNFGDVSQTSQESDKIINKESELAVYSDKNDTGELKTENGIGEEESHVDKSSMLDHCSNITALDEQLDKDRVHSGKQVEADDNANGLVKHQLDTVSCESRADSVAKVKEEQTQNGDSILPASSGGMAVLQRALDSVGSGLEHHISNGDIREVQVSNVDKREVVSEEEEDEDNDDDSGINEGDSLLESSLRASMRSSESVTQGVDNPGGGGGLSLPGRPAGLGRSLPALEPAPRTIQHGRSNGNPSSRPSVPVEDNQLNGDIGNGSGETGEKLQRIRVKFLRLAQRLGQSAQNVVVAQVLYRLELAEQLRAGQSSSRTGNFSFERANVIAEEQEAAGQEELDFTCTIMLLGKTGVGKSATINSIFDEVKSGTDAFSPATNKVREIIGTIHGIKLRIIDTPGLLPSFADQRRNGRIMSSVKRFIKKSPPDIVLYFDRLDMQSRDYGDLPLLRTITDTFGAAIWFNAIVVLTHASSAPPDGANGAPLSYEMFVAQRSHVVQQTIRQAAGDMRLMNPVSLVENHPACRTNRSGQRVLPNGQVWKPQLLLLCFASKILAEANSLLKLQDSSPTRPFGIRSRVPPLPFLLSSLLQSRAQLKLPEDQMGDEDESDEDLGEDSESDDEVGYDELPPFRRLTKDEVALLDKEQKRAYFEELEYREKLFKKKQWKEELRRRAEMKKRMAAASKEEPRPSDEFFEEENSRAAAVPVPMPDMVLPPSFDSDNPSHRYRYLETANQWLVRPVLEPHGWDHDNGYDGFNMEKMFVVAKKVPASVSGQITKDKKEANLQMEGAVTLKHGEGKSTLCGLDVQTIGKDLAYTLRSETRFSNFRQNKTTGGLAVTFLGDTVSAGMKLEDKLTVGRRLKLVLNAGAITGRKDVAYGGSFEATLREKDYPIGRALTTLGFSIMNWHGDLAIGGNLQSQVVIWKTLIVGRANLNNRGAGQISIRVSSSEQLQLALLGIMPIMRALVANRILSSSQPGQ